MTKSIKGECPGCSGIKFIIEAEMMHNGILDDQGNLLLSAGEIGQVAFIACIACGKEINQKHFLKII